MEDGISQQYKRDQLAQGPGQKIDRRKMSWTAIERELNAAFEGTVIDGVARPYRSEWSLPTDRSRIPDLATLTGTTVKLKQLTRKAGTPVVDSRDEDYKPVKEKVRKDGDGKGAEESKRGEKKGSEWGEVMGRDTMSSDLLIAGGSESYACVDITLGCA